MKIMGNKIWFFVLCLIDTTTIFCAAPKRVVEKQIVLRQKIDIDWQIPCVSMMACCMAVATSCAISSVCAQEKEKDACLANMKDMACLASGCCLVGVYTGCVTCARIWQVYEPECCKAKKKPCNKAKNVQQMTMKRDFYTIFIIKE